MRIFSLPPCETKEEMKSKLLVPVKWAPDGFISRLSSLQSVLFEVSSITLFTFPVIQFMTRIISREGAIASSPVMLQFDIRYLYQRDEDDPDVIPSNTLHRKLIQFG
jgi:hypothetical protein